MDTLFSYFEYHTYFKVLLYYLNRIDPFGPPDFVAYKLNQKHMSVFPFDADQVKDPIQLNFQKGCFLPDLIISHGIIQG